jgi:hypothetical protein
MNLIFSFIIIISKDAENALLIKPSNKKPPELAARELYMKKRLLSEIETKRLNTKYI